MLPAGIVVIGKNDDVAVPNIACPSCIQMTLAGAARIAGSHQPPGLQGVNVLFAFGEVDRRRAQYVREAVRHARTVAKAILCSVVINLIACPFPGGLAGSAFGFRIGKVFALRQPHDDAASGYTADPIRIGRSGCFNSARTDLNESLLPVRLQITDNLEKQVPVMACVRVTLNFAPPAICLPGFDPAHDPEGLGLRRFEIRARERHFKVDDVAAVAADGVAIPSACSGFHFEVRVLAAVPGTAATPLRARLLQVGDAVLVEAGHFAGCECDVVHARRPSGLLPAAAGPRLQPRGNVFRLVADGSADLDVFRPLPQEPPPPDGSHREARDTGHVVLVQQRFENTIHRCHFAPFPGFQNCCS